MFVCNLADTFAGCMCIQIHLQERSAFWDGHHLHFETFAKYICIDNYAWTFASNLATWLDSTLLDSVDLSCSCVYVCSDKWLSVNLMTRHFAALTYYAHESVDVHIVVNWLSDTWWHAIVKRWPFMLLSSTSVSLVIVPSDTNALWLAYELVLAATLPFDWHLLRQVEPSNFEILVHLHFGHFLLGLLVYR